MDYDKCTPLMISLFENKQRSLKVLLELGASPLLGGGQIGTSLHLAVTTLLLISGLKIKPRINPKIP